MPTQVVRQVVELSRDCGELLSRLGAQAQDLSSGSQGFSDSRVDKGASVAGGDEGVESDPRPRADADAERLNRQAVAPLTQCVLPIW